MKRLLVRLWWVGVLLLAAAQVPRLSVLRSAVPALPASTPLDLVRADLARSWGFLNAARDHLHPGTTVVCWAENPERDMEMYMLARGLLTGYRVVPRSYFGVPTPEAAKLATVVLAYPCPQPLPAGWKVSWRGDGGCILTRLGGGQ
jgi:hypothetical protein